MVDISLKIATACLPWLYVTIFTPFSVPAENISIISLQESKVPWKRKSRDLALRLNQDFSETVLH